MTRKNFFRIHTSIDVAAGVVIRIVWLTGMLLALFRVPISMSYLRLCVRRHGLLVAMLLFTVMPPGAHASQESGVASAADSVQSRADQPMVTAPSLNPPTFADNAFAYAYGSTYRNPYVTSAAQPRGADIARNIIEFKHVDAWRYGHNFVDVFLKSSNDVEPAAGGGSGALDFYSIFRSGVSINRVAGKPIISLGPLHDIDIQGGVNLQTKNTDMAPSARTLFFGPNLQFHIGSGFVNVGLQLRKEWNHNGILGKNEEYDLGFNIEPVWRLPFRLGRANFVFDGFAAYNTAKGKDAAGRETRAEFMARPQLKLDIGSLVGLTSDVLELGVGIEYWHNMFGKDADTVPGANQSAPFISLVVHLPSSGSGH